MAKPVLVIHGGLNSKKSFNENYEGYQQALERIATRGYEYLKIHGAVKAAIYTVKMLEDEPLLNAGTGSMIQSDGVIRMSASLMDGSTKTFSGVMNIENIKNPVEVAAFLQNEKDRVLAGAQAKDYAKKHNVKDYYPETLQRRQEFEAKIKTKKPTSTVGCVALGADGKLAAATSTGGKGWEIPGRVGDSPTIAGNFANKFCAVSATGVGEDIISVGLAASLVTRVTDKLELKKAAKKTIAELSAIKGSAGFIALTSKGEFTALATESHLTWAKIDAKGLVLFK